MIGNITEGKKNALNSSVERCCINIKCSNKAEWKNREYTFFTLKFKRTSGQDGGVVKNGLPHCTSTPKLQPKF